MDWWLPFTPSDLYASLRGSPDPSGGTQPCEPASVWPTWWGHEEPSAVEVSLLQIIYEFKAAATSCTRCGAPLGRHLRVEARPTLLESVRWRVSVRTQCRGWRRHRHAASVGRSPDDLVLGSLQRVM